MNFIFLICLSKMNLFSNLISRQRMTYIYLYLISGGIASHVTIDYDDDLLVVFTFRYTKFGSNMSSYAIMSSLVTGKFSSWFLLITIKQYLSEGLIIILCIFLANWYC